MKQISVISISITLIIFLFSIMALSGCKTSSGKTIRWTPYASNKSMTKTIASRSAGAKVTQSSSNSCEGIVITDTGKDLFRNVYPYIFVAIENNSEIRREITLDIKWRRKGKNYFGAYEDSVWTVFGPHPLRPDEKARLVVKKNPDKDLTMEEVHIVKCE